MEVETRPPLVDGKLGLHALRSSPDLSLAITENDIPSDEERELLQSPVEDRITCVKDALVNGSEHKNELENVPSKICSDSPMCNGDIASECVSDAANVFRTKNVCGAVRATELSDAKLHTGRDEDATDEPICTTFSLSEEESGLGEESNNNKEECSRSRSGKSSSSDDSCEDVSGTDVIVEDPCSLDASELHVEQKLVEPSSKNDKLEVNNELPIAIANGSSSVESSVDIKSDLVSEQLLDSDLSLKSSKDFADGLDEMVIPQVIDISSICMSKEIEHEPTSAANGEVEVDEIEIPRVIDISSICLSKENEDVPISAASGEVEVDEMEIPRVIDISSVCMSKEIEDEPTSAASGEVEVDKMEIPRVIDISSVCMSKEIEDEPTSAASGEVNGIAASIEGVEAETAVSDVGDGTVAACEYGETGGAVEGDKAGAEPADDTTFVSLRDLSPSAAASEVEENGVAASVETDVFGIVDEAGPSEDSEKTTEEEDVKIGTEPADEVPVASRRDGKMVGPSTDERKQNELLVDEEGAKDGADEDNSTGTGVDDVHSDVSATPGADVSTEADFPAEETMVDDSMDFDQEEDGSPGYQGMTDDILPIIESELDDIPVGEGNIFDTEVECDDCTSMVEETEDTHDDEASTNLPADLDIGDDVASHPVSESSRTTDKEPEERSTKKNIENNFPLSGRVKLKRRASADSVELPPNKIMKRQCSLDNLNECSERFDRVQSLDEFKPLSGKKLSAAPANIASEPLDIPIEIEANEAEPAPIPAKRRKAATDDVKAAVDAPLSTTESVVQQTEPSVKQKTPSVEHKEQSLLVIDLDDDDDKPETSTPACESQSQVKEQAEPSKSAPRSALDVLFNGKKEITLNRKMFSKIMKSYVSQYLLTFSDLGKATSLSLKANDVLAKIQSNVSNYEKQKDDFKSIMNKLIEDRQARKTWDETVVPPKATRSVGLQVCSVGSMYVKNADSEETSLSTLNKNPTRAKVQSSSSTNQSQAMAQQKQAFAQQQMAMAQSRAKQAEQQIANIRPIAKKSVTPTNRPMVIRTVPATKQVTPLKPKSIGPQFPVTTPKLNGLKAVTVTRNPEPSGNPNTTPLTVTTVSPNSRTFTLSNKGTFAVKSPQKPAVQLPSQFKPSNMMLSKALSSGGVPARGNTITIASKPAPQNPSKVVPIAVTHTPGNVQNSKNLASGPGRPGKPSATIKVPGDRSSIPRPSANTSIKNLNVLSYPGSFAIFTSDPFKGQVKPKKVSSVNLLSSPSAITSAVNRVLQSKAQVDKLKKPASAVPDTTIDLTDLDDDLPQPTKPTVTPSNTTARKSTTPTSRVIVPAKVPTVGLSSKQMRHPALPPNPQHFNPSSAPPRPYLGICDTQAVTQGIMLTWHFNNIIPLRKISKFQVFAYQETKGDLEDAWKKVGDVDALPLPMACTLTQFREGYTYHFIVRALDEVGQVGPFSAPNTITLMKKTV